MRVLIVEDDPSLALIEQRALEDAGFEVRVCATGRCGLRLLRVWSPNLILLDHGLPDAHGRDLIHDIRNESRVPIIVVTGHIDEHDRVAGLEAGADDYVTKPFSIPELVARIRAVLRRAAGPAQERSNLLTFKDLTLDRDLRRVRCGDEEVELTRTEFEILRVLLQGRGVVVTRDEMARAVWNRSGSSVGKLMDVHMSILRKKLGDDPKKPTYVATVRGVGFRLCEP